MSKDRGGVDALEARGFIRSRLRSLPRPSLPLFLAVCAVMAITSGVSVWVGFGDVTIYMALVALYIAIGAFGGTLRADLSVALLFACGLLLFVGGPLLAVGYSPYAGAALLVLAVGACALIPALGQRYRSVRTGIGLVTVYAFGYDATRQPDTTHVVVGSFLALGIIVVIRLLAAIPDPDAPLRRAIAAVVLDASASSVTSAAAVWLGGPSRAWTGQALVGAVQFRTARWSFFHRRQSLNGAAADHLDAFAAAADAAAARVGALIRARRSQHAQVHAVLGDVEALEPLRLALHADDQRAALTAVQGLRQAALASLTRERRVVREAVRTRRAMAFTALRAALSLDSDYFRTALRSMVTIAVALLVVTVADQPAFALPLLTGAYGVLQPTFAGSLAEARRRTIGVICGAAIALVVVATASPQVATIASTLALVVAFAYIASSITVFMGSLVVTLTIAIAPVVHVDPQTYAVGYSMAVVAGAALATTAGFITIPAPTLQRRRRAMSRAIRATGVALDGIGRSTTKDLRATMLTALRAQQNTTSTTIDADRGPDAEASAALDGLNLLGLALILGLAERGPRVEATLHAVVTGLHSDARHPLGEGRPSPDQVESPADGASADPIRQLLEVEYNRLYAALRSADETAERAGAELGQTA